MAAVACLLTGFCLVLLLSGGNAFEKVIYNAQVPLSSQCGQSNPLQDDEQLMETLKMIHQQLTRPECKPPYIFSCEDAIRCNPSASSGYYQIQAANGSAVHVYCDMEGTHCGGKEGWMRVVHLNMTDPSSQCPVGFRVQTDNDKRFCIRDLAGNLCQSMLFDSIKAYSKVCGYVRGYSISTPDAFDTRNSGRIVSEPLSGNYVDGVSITYGTPPTHIWTYAAGVSENWALYACPCNTQPGPSPPSYVGTDYYCESAVEDAMRDDIWYTDDPLWDGLDCGIREAPCCNISGLPWFSKDTQTMTSDNIEVRLCLDENIENIGIECLELYVK